MATNNAVNVGLSGSTGSGNFVGSTSPTLVTPLLGTPTSGNLANCTFPTLNQNTTGTAGGITAGNANVPAFSAYNANSTTCAANGFTKIAMDTAVFDIGSYYDHTTNYRYTPLKAGIYQICWSVYINPTNLVTGVQYIAVLYKNGSAYAYGNPSVCINSVQGTSSGNSVTVSMNGSTDYLEVYFQNTNAATTITTNNSQLVTYFTGHYVGPNS